ncbi:MAG: hypothetical protein GF364_16500 [Candidatus Lokiarchaeota archaeon]|nr:hypothetical protein [Candidatus Lokiarchaeota archaeon]
MSEENVKEVEKSAESTKRGGGIDKPKRDAILYGVLGISFIVTMIVRNFLPFGITFMALLILNWIFDYLDKKKAPKKQKEPLEEQTRMEKKVAGIRQTQRKIGVIFGALIIVGFLLMQFMDEGFYITVAFILIGTVIAIILTKKEQAAIEEGHILERKSTRIQYVDVFRGLVVIFLIISVLTWDLSGVVGDPNTPPVGPTYLNHGWKFWELDGWPDMITIIDIGQQILMFIVGFVGAIAFYKHEERDGKSKAILHLIRRFLALMILSFLYDGGLIDGEMDLTQWNMFSTFWYGTFANLAWGTLISILLVSVLKQKPDKRFLIACIIFTAHAILYSFDTLHTWELRVGADSWKIWEVPWNTINHVAIAIMGTCTYDWSQQKTEDEPYKGWTKRILPIGSVMWAGVWLLNFLQPAHHQTSNTTLSLMACATSMWILFLFNLMDKVKFKVPLLADLGRNLLIMFIMSDLWNKMIDLVGKDAFRASGLLSMLLVGIVPIVVQFMLAWSLNKLRVTIKF